MALQASSYRQLRELVAPVWHGPYPAHTEWQSVHCAAIDGLTSNPAGYATILAQRVAQGAVSPQKARGLEEFLAKLLDFWNLTADEGGALLGYPPQCTFKVMRIAAGLATFENADERDRVLALFEIRRLLSGLFRDRQVENRWLRTPNDGLDGSSPLNLLLSRSFANVLRVRQFVEDLAGV